MKIEGIEIQSRTIDPYPCGCVVAQGWEPDEDGNLPIYIFKGDNHGDDMPEGACDLLNQVELMGREQELGGPE